MQPEALADDFAMHRVVEIARRLAIDGDQRHFAQVAPARHLSRADLGRNPRGLGFDFRRELVRQLVLAQRDLDLHARVGGVAQHLHDAGDRRAVAAGLLDDLGHDDLAMRRVAARVGGDQHVVMQPAIGRLDPADAVLQVKAPDDGGVGALQHLDDLAFDAPAPVDARLAHHDAVTVQHLRHLARIEEHVGLLVVADEKAEAVGMALHGAGHEVDLLGDAQGAAPVDDDLTGAGHGLEPPGEELDLVVGDGEALDQIFLLQRRALGFHHLQDEFPRWQGILVGRALALEKRVGLPQRHGGALAGTGGLQFFRRHGGGRKRSGWFDKARRSG